MARNLLGSLRSGKYAESTESSSSELTHSNNSYKVSSDFDDSKGTEQHSDLSRDHLFLDKKLVEHWTSIYEQVEYEGRNRFDPNLMWTKREEADIVRKLDFRVMLLVWLMFLSLDLIRQNLNRALASKSEKVSGNIFADLNITQNDVNNGLICTYVAFLVMELPSGLISKRIGPEVWIPAQIIGWSIISAAQSAIRNKTGFFFTRVLLGMCQGGFVPDMGLYLTYFYTSKELNTRMSWFYTVLGASQIIGSFLSAGFMSLNGWHGVAGWRYLFAFDSVISGLIGTAAFLLMPGAITHTTTPIIRKPWLNEREQSILVNRLLRDDPSKGDMNNRQSVTWGGIWNCIKDYDAYPVYILGLTIMIPDQPPKTYLSFILSQLGFSTLLSNLLTIPSMALFMINAIWMTRLVNRTRERSATAMITNVWMLPCLVALVTIPQTLNSKYWNWVRYGLNSLVAAYPYPLPFMVGWVSQNAHSVQSRTISLCFLNMSVQVGSICATFIYTNRDQPFYIQGNSALIAISAFSIVQCWLTRRYFKSRNSRNQIQWESFTPEQQTSHSLHTYQRLRPLNVPLVY